jgi:hypothetical protein
LLAYYHLHTASLQELTAKNRDGRSELTEVVMGDLSLQKFIVESRPIEHDQEQFSLSIFKDFVILSRLYLKLQNVVYNIL